MSALEKPRAILLQGAIGRTVRRRIRRCVDTESAAEGFADFVEQAAERRLFELGFDEELVLGRGSRASRRCRRDR
jgi:hypothetical protein